MGKPFQWTTRANKIHVSDWYKPGYVEANSKLCEPNHGEHVRLLILITSAPSHEAQRLAIRQTWGHYAIRRDVAMSFILGSTPNKTLDDLLKAESTMYGDMIRDHFLDTYDNLTLKAISMLEWTHTYCSKAKFILKTDDDMFINVPHLLSVLDQYKSSDRAIYGALHTDFPPNRYEQSKYYVSHQVYFPSVYPDFITGPLYVVGAGAVHDLYKKSLTLPYLKLEDVFLTGIVSQIIGVKRFDMSNEILGFNTDFNACILRRATGLHSVRPNEQIDLYKKLIDTNIKCSGNKIDKTYDEFGDYD